MQKIRGSFHKKYSNKSTKEEYQIIREDMKVLFRIKDINLARSMKQKFSANMKRIEGFK